MRLVFAGTPVFAEVALRALLNAGHDVAMVLTRPDQPAGRGLRPRPSPVKALALEHRLTLAQPPTLSSPEALKALRAARAQVMVVAAYGLILPPAVLDLPLLGCINIHASLLPRWRGAAPIQRAILAGDRETGISIMRMDAGLDTGPLYLTHAIPIESEDTAGSLHDKLAALGGRCIARVLAGLDEAGQLQPVPQAAEGVTYAHKIEKREASIDWSRPAAEIERQVRAFNPLPVAGTLLRGQLLRIWRARAVGHRPGVPGRVIDATDGGILVGCGSGVLRIEELQRPGSKRLSAAEFLRGASVSSGELLGG
ncbi:MAG TPA: methionyl-tRNA formyltransferase [Burkholderiales bacterium]|nr:methionyl-tRNA formyltransferase [Burkholderiales bacterium]